MSLSKNYSNVNDTNRSDEEDVDARQSKPDQRLAVDSEKTRCGFLGIWTPEYLQPLANMKTFVVMYIFQDIFRSMFFTYWSSSISTVEKRYRLPSKLVGSFSAMGEIGKILCVLLFAHFGGRGHRPRWMAFACMCVALAAIIIVIPETFVPLPSQGDLVSYQNSSSSSKRNSKLKSVEEMCTVSSGLVKNGSSECTAGEKLEANARQATLNNKIWLAIALFIFGHAVIDAGGGIPRTVGVPFVYDNVKLSNTPLYYVFMYAGRLVGPLSGYTLGSLTSRVYIDPANTPDGLNQNDPQWIGAWYLGFIGIFFGDLVAAFSFLWFPGQVRRKATATKIEGGDEEVALDKKTTPNKALSQKSRYGEKGQQASQMAKARLSDLPRDLLQLLRNPFILFVIFGRAIDVLGSAGFRSLMPKYLENHFRVTASKANVFTGVSGVLAYALSGFIGALLIKKFKLQPRGIATIMLVTQIIVALGTTGLTMFPCDSPRMANQITPNSPFDIRTTCSQDCACVDSSFTPVCDRSTGITYYSPCRAGCISRLSNAQLIETLSGRSDVNNLELEIYKQQHSEAYTNCSCTADATQILIRGYCMGGEKTQCDNMFYWYNIAKMALTFVGGLPSVGGVMLLFRMVEPELKSLASGLLSLTVTVMGFLPGSFLAGFILDWSCILWSTGFSACGSSAATGLSNCLLYDNTALRFRYHVTVSVLRTFGLIFDAAILWWVWNVKFPDAPAKDKRSNKNSKITTSF